MLQTCPSVPHHQMPRLPPTHRNESQEHLPHHHYHAKIPQSTAEQGGEGRGSITAGASCLSGDSGRDCTSCHARVKERERERERESDKGQRASARGCP